MKRLPAEYLKMRARKAFVLWVGEFRLNNAMKVHAELGRLLRAEKKRRKELG